MRLLPLILALIAFPFALPAAAQSPFDVPATTTPAAPPIPAMAPPSLDPGDSMNPVALMNSAAQLLPKPNPASAEAPKGLSTVLNIMLLMTVIALAPSLILMTTCFVRILIVLSLLRQAIGAQSLPPPQVTMGLALFMTILVMAPTGERIHREAIVPYNQGQVTSYDDLWNRAKQPMRDFMFDQIQSTGNWSSLYMILNYRGVDTSKPESLTRADVDMVSLVPAYMLSELKTAFLMGFRVYLPFLVIDMVISTMLISMSMMMLPPVLISLPFKLLLFVMVDGWQLVVGSLMSSFVQPLAPAVSMLLPGLGPVIT
jgi:flagellar biosynthesis protein FliP